MDVRQFESGPKSARHPKSLLQVLSELQQTVNVKQLQVKKVDISSKLFSSKDGTNLSCLLFSN